MNFIRNTDLYGVPVPSFNLKGEAEVKTVVGGLLTFSIILLVLYYASNTMIEVLERQNPIMSTVTIEDYYD